MSKTVLLIVLVVGIGMIGFGIFFAFPSGNFIESFSPESSGSSEIPLYDGQSSPSEIPIYENNVPITPVDPNK